MKLTLVFLALFTISSCANQARRRGPNLTNIEGESETTEQSEETSLESKVSDRAPKGEIELGITGESTEGVVIEDGEETPKTEDTAEEKKEVSDDEKKAVEKVDCKKNPKHKSCVLKKKIEKKTDDTELIINKPESPESPETPE